MYLVKLAIQPDCKKYFYSALKWVDFLCERSVLIKRTFEPVCFFVSDQSDIADVEFFEDLVNVPLHRFKRQVSYISSERRLWRQLLLLPGTSGGTTTRAGASGEKENQEIQQQLMYLFFYKESVSS